VEHLNRYHRGSDDLYSVRLRLEVTGWLTDPPDSITREFSNFWGITLLPVQSRDVVRGVRFGDRDALSRKLQHLGQQRGSAASCVEEKNKFTFGISQLLRHPMERRQRHDDQPLAVHHLGVLDEWTGFRGPHAEPLRFRLNEHRIGVVDSKEGDVIVVEDILGVHEAVVRTDVVVHGAYVENVKLVEHPDVQDVSAARVVLRFSRVCDLSGSAVDPPDETLECRKPESCYFEPKGRDHPPYQKWISE